MICVQHSCGFVGTYSTQRRADYALSRHACDRWREKAAAHERGERLRAAIDRTPQPCRCKQARHQHGTYVCYVVDQCRCDPCRIAATSYERRRTRDHAYGRHRFVDATRAREHALDLRAAGIGLKRLAALSGVSHGALSKLVYGDPSNNRPPTRRIRPDTETAILNVTAHLEVMSPGRVVDGLATRRRIQGLVWLGWSIQRLSRELSLSRPAIDKLLGGGDVHVQTALIVQAAFRRMWQQPPPESTWHEKSAATRSRNHARRMGWKPPAWWDDSDIGRLADVAPTDDSDIDEVAVLRVLQGDPPASLTRAERREAVRRMHDDGVSYELMASRLGTHSRKVHRDLVAMGLIDRERSEVSA